MMNDTHDTSHTVLNTRNIVAIGAIAFIFLIIALVSINRNNFQRIDEIRPTVVRNVPFVAPRISARAAIVWDMSRNKAVYELNSTSSLPLASLTKILTAVAALETVPEYTLVPVEADALAQEGDTGLRLHERWNVRELVKLSLVASSNDGSHAIASAVGAVLNENQTTDTTTTAAVERFVKRMNEIARTLGLRNTTARNEHGLDISVNMSGANGSARDVATLLGYAWKTYPGILEPTTEPSLATYAADGTLHIAKNTNPITGTIPGLMASKTGFTDLAGGNVAVIASPGMAGPFAIVVLGSSYEGRFADLEALSRATLEYVIKNR